MKPTAVATSSRDGFSGYFFQPSVPYDRAFIVLIGDEGKDFINIACAKWLTSVLNCGALCMGVRQNPQDDTGVHRWPLESVERAAGWLSGKGIKKIGILGMSMQTAIALSAASLIPSISMVIAISPCDFVPWGFYQGKLGKSWKREWPSGTSTLTWRDRELPFQPAGLDRDSYWNMFLEEKKKHRELHSRPIFEKSEQLHPIRESSFIKAERICGSIILIGAEDDSMWDSVRYIRRMQRRLEAKEFTHPVHALVYPVGTHLIMPEALLNSGFPGFAEISSAVFVSGKQHPRECRKARLDLERRLSALVQAW